MSNDYTDNPGSPKNIKKITYKLFKYQSCYKYCYNSSTCDSSYLH